MSTQEPDPPTQAMPKPPLPMRSTAVRATENRAKLA